jgi:hypothetical protein
MGDCWARAAARLDKHLITGWMPYNGVHCRFSDRWHGPRGTEQTHVEDAGDGYTDE